MHPRSRAPRTFSQEAAGPVATTAGPPEPGTLPRPKLTLRGPFLHEREHMERWTLADIGEFLQRFSDYWPLALVQRDYSPEQTALAVGTWIGAVLHYSPAFALLVLDEINRLQGGHKAPTTSFFIKVAESMGLKNGGSHG